ncbi:MAG: glycosyltransferase family 39 protein [Patescibacteria group bacterium]|nr:glycosyltransferase family 39 protein [Patescibacteria group bacterium]
MRFLYNLRNALSRHTHVLFLAILAIVFFVSVSLYNFYGQADNFVKWSSPDETANYQMAKQYAEYSKLFSLEKYNLIVDGIIAPRSLRANGVFLQPMSFLGIMIYYGAIAKIFGVGILPYLTPLLGAVGIIYFYLLISQLFNKKIGLISATILTSFPVYIYFSAHSFFHNIPFVVFLIISLYYFVLASKYRAFCSKDDQGEDFIGRKKHYLTWLYAALAGFFLGLSVGFRTSELLWIAPALLILWLFNIRKIGFFKLALVIYFAALAYSPIVYWNTILYGGPFSSGYPKMDESVFNIVSSGTSLVTDTFYKQDLGFISFYADKLYKAIFTFGFHPLQSLAMVYNYIYGMFTWLVVLAGLGFIFYIFHYKNKKKSVFVYVLAYLALTVILSFYYGSWKFNDNPDPNSITIGNSYTRYWLPIYLGAIPFVAIALDSLAKIAILKRAKQAILISFLAILSGFSIFFVLYGSDEGLISSYYRLRESRIEYEKVISLTQSDSVIITRYHDKLFFPERRVIFGLLTDNEMNKRYAILAKKMPVYYYNFKLKQSDLDYLNNSKLKAVGLTIKKMANITNSFELYLLETSSKKIAD